MSKEWGEIPVCGEVAARVSRIASDLTEGNLFDHDGKAFVFDYMLIDLEAHVNGAPYVDGNVSLGKVFDSLGL